ncbi:tripartite tricarboxylate transporter substrate binding protein [Variovorax dokdonensis]|uniref:Tripartite tricarboxylate transporter substrate binding protein n=1 Tax=Variovorax dokdonensis TaxID=344883 RepID=A0ABT7NGP2_9BURK|nr:tripartite tricarboxylate transporter substrate binding protein [Variovorax dokdonensis]MDM0047103.1 tripartite tricarboxylate transporter substrate binding protein [Variovorax dokdonensis]
MTPEQRSRRALGRALMALPLAALLPQGAGAQPQDNNIAWPTKPVRVVVAAAAGGGTDVFARLLSDKLGTAFKQSFIVDNKAGANGLLAAEAVSRAAPDGYTLLFSYTAAMLINPAMHVKSPVDPLMDFEPVAQVGSVGNMLVVTPDLPVHNLQELAAYAKAQPGEMSYGSWGTGSGGHLVMEDYARRAGLKVVHVPYKGVAPLAADLLGGSIKVAWVDVSSQIQHVQAGKLRAIAISGSARAPQTPEVKTMGEQGYPLDVDAWYGLFAPARTPPELVQRINREVVRIMGQPDVRARLLQLNMPNPPTPSAEEFKRRVASDYKAWQTMVKAAGIQPE